MDIETEKIIELLFPDRIPESWKENLDFHHYLSKIGSYDVDELNKEPDHLNNEKATVQQMIQDLVFSNYNIFIHTADNSREIFNRFNQTENSLDDLLGNIPEFINKCKFFCNKSKDINMHRRLNNLTLSKNAEILEILELPYLMEMCLENDLYNEALELSQYARYLGIKHGDISIVAKIVNNIENSWSCMVNKVVNSLKDDLPLPKCLQLIGLLRSMDAFSESELRIKFIQARDSWFQALLDSIPQENINNHLTKTIELSRIHLFNIITQYKAIFNDDDHLVLGLDIIINDAAIFHQWLEEKVSQFLTTLEQDLPNVTSIDSILGQCTYFGLSFGRVGADITGRMADIFMKVIRNNFEFHISEATKQFIKNIEHFVLFHKSQKIDFKIDPVAYNENPPEQIVEYYPLAEYCNELISAFNELRLNTPIALAQEFSKLIQNSLHQVAKAMLSFYKKRQKNFTPGDRDSMVIFTECFSDYLIPYLQYCIHTIFPPNQVAAHLGISVSHLQKEEVTYWDLKHIIQPIEFLLPVKNMNMNILTNALVKESKEYNISNAESTEKEYIVESNQLKEFPINMNKKTNTSIAVQTIDSSTSLQNAENLENIIDSSKDVTSNDNKDP